MNNLLEKLFDKLDSYLHKECTYLDLQDRVFSLEIDIEEKDGIIETYEEDCEQRVWRR